jgi:hypothetical protein
MIDVENNKSKFISYLTGYCSQREGLNRILDMLNRTDFFIAPASKKYHLSEEGGVCAHSLNVFYNMLDFLAIDYRDNNIFDIVNKIKDGEAVSDEVKSLLDEASKTVFGEKVGFISIVLTSLLHDCHKINFYEKVEKSVYKGTDSFGKKIFETEVQYQMREDRLVFGNSGTNSNYIITSYLKLGFEEQLAIENHHGCDINGAQLPASSQAWTKSKLALYLHLADMKAAFTGG